MNDRFVTFAGAALAVAVLAPSVSAAGPSARDVFARQEDARKIREVTSTATLTTGAPGGDSKVKSFTWWRKLAADGVRFRTLTRFTAPAEIRGEGILFEEREQHNNDVQLYLPAFKKVRRVEGASQSSSFMGSVFSYSDIANPHVDDYKHTLVRSEPCPSDAKTSCFVLELAPASDGVKERTGYSKLIEWIRSDNFMAEKGEFYDAQGALWKVMTASSFREVDPAAHKWMALEIRIDDVKSKKFTTLKFSDVKVNTGIPDATFSQQNLARDN